MALFRRGLVIDGRGGGKVEFAAAEGNVMEADVDLVSLQNAIALRIEARIESGLLSSVADRFDFDQFLGPRQ